MTPITSNKSLFLFTKKMPKGKQLERLLPSGGRIRLDMVRPGTVLNSIVLVDGTYGEFAYDEGSESLLVTYGYVMQLDGDWDVYCANYLSLLQFNGKKWEQGYEFPVLSTMEQDKASLQNLTKYAKTAIRKVAKSLGSNNIVKVMQGMDSDGVFKERVK